MEHFPLLLASAALLFLAASYRFRWYETPYTSKKRAHNLLVVGCALCCLAPCIAVFCTLPHENIAYPFEGLLENQNAYEQQFDAFLKRQIALDFAPDERILSLENPYIWDARTETGAWYPWDRVLYDGQYYSYFGIAPILTIYFPWYFITGTLPAAGTVCFILCMVGILAAAALLVALVRRFVPNATLSLLCLGIFAVSFGSLMFMVQASADMYYIAVQSGMTNLILFLLFTVLGCGKNGKTPRRAVCLFLAAVFLVLTALSRPNLLLFALVSVPLFLSMLTEKTVRPSRRAVKLLSFIVPTLLGAAFVMWYNYVRFDSVFEFGARYQLTVADVSTYSVSLALLLPSIYCYFLQMPIVQGKFPYLVLTYEPIQSYGGYLYTTWMMGVFAMPSLSGILLSPIARRRGGKKDNVKLFTFILAAFCCFLLAFVDICFAGVCIRYLADITAVAAVFSTALWLDLDTRAASLSHGKRFAVYAVISALLFATILVGTLLIFENERRYLLQPTV